MNRQQKVEVVDYLQGNFSKSAASFLVNVQKLNVKQMEDLRRELRQNGGKLKIAKARLLRLAIGNVQKGHDLLPFCKEQIGIVFTSEEPPVIAKVLHEFSKKNAALNIVACCLDADVLDAGSVVRMASLPSKDVLRAQLCGTLNMPIVNLVQVLNMLTLRLLFVLKQIGDQKQS
ncbi:MAG TPA: 50S ribosomal protein L10 [Candidatus Babeliales bacterium]|nr:50S ribosomal protein L10 [Candidatus Babeliales bacterium]